jgi:hypothetical protein
MEITLIRVDDRVSDRAELADFLTGNEFPFHVIRRPVRADVEGWIGEGRFGDADHAWPRNIAARVTAPRC